MAKFDKCTACRHLVYSVAAIAGREERSNLVVNVDSTIEARITTNRNARRGRASARGVQADR